MNPLNSVRGALTAGVILAVIVMLILQPHAIAFSELGLAVWLLANSFPALP